MARDVDAIIDYVKRQTHIPPIHRQILINRIDPEPTLEEIDRASDQVYPKENRG